MKSLIKSLLIISLASVTLTGCVPSLSPDNYTTTGAGQVNRVVKGTIVSARIVEVSNEDNTAGTIAGGLLGGVAGSTIGGSTNANVLGAVGGAVVGGILGNQIQKGMSRQTGIEYVIKTKHGLISVVQGLSPAFQRGQHVLVEYGERARVIPDPDYS